MAVEQNSLRCGSFAWLHAKVWTTNGAKGAKAEPALFTPFAIFAGFAVQDFAHRSWLSHNGGKELSTD
jgi:hypothetical protein